MTELFDVNVTKTIFFLQIYFSDLCMVGNHAYNFIVGMGGGSFFISFPYFKNIFKKNKKF